MFGKHTPHGFKLVAAAALATLAAFSAPSVLGADAIYYPPPEKSGGWRALVRANQAANEAEKQAVREKTGLDWDKLQAAWNYCAGFGGPHSFLVIRHGWVAGEWNNYSTPQGIASCTKSLTGLAMARLFDLSDAGKLTQPITLDAEAWRFLPAPWSEAEPARRQIRLRHMLTMTSGLTPYDRPYKEDYLKQVFAQTVEAPPSTVWAYASVPVDMLSLVIENVTGRKMGDFVNGEILARIGVAPVQWGEFSGHTGGSGGPKGGARFLPRDLARLGYLVLHDGVWEAGGRHEQVLGAARLREFTRHAPWLETARHREPNFAFEPNAQMNYGYLWWTNHTGENLGPAAPRDIVYMSGWGKQACFVAPGLDMVVVRLGPHKPLNDHPEFYQELWTRIMAAVSDQPAVSTAMPVPAGAPAATPATPAVAKAVPFDGGHFKGRIAWSADGNYNDPDDWSASPVALAIFAACGLQDKLVHFDYNCILTQSKPGMEKEHAASVLGTAKRYGFHETLFYDCQKDLKGATQSIRRAIDASSADDPLYFVLAGPMEVPALGIAQSDPAKRQYVYCISHNNWNDGYASGNLVKHNKRDIIPLGVKWIQIQDQNPLLMSSPYGRAPKPAEWRPFFWMRDSADPNNRFQWERLLASTRPDCSDAGMGYFLVTGDEQCDIAKLKSLMDEKKIPAPISPRTRIRLEAENFRVLEEGEVVFYKKDRTISQRLFVSLKGRGTGRVQTVFDEPYTATRARYDVEVRYAGGKGGPTQFRLLVGGRPQGSAWEGAGPQWQTRTIPGLRINTGDEIAVEAHGGAGEYGKLDYVQLNLLRE